MFVIMRNADRDTVQAFEQAVVTIANVLPAQPLFGDPDHLLRVIARDLPDFRHVYDNRLATLPGVQGLSSTLVMTSPRTGRCRCGRWPSRRRPRHPCPGAGGRLRDAARSSTMLTRRIRPADD